MKPITRRPKAVEDVESHAMYIADGSIDVALRFLERAEQTIIGLAMFPESGAPLVTGVPTPASLPKAVWINAPKRKEELKSEAPEANCPGAPEVTSLTHPRSGYPLDGCVPAESSSVSPDVDTVPATNSL
ncbi:type II toxin-antitoxin system RelE/ParE family toxin, partial [Novipirellula sp.]|uniref:type II toxin-antitoxin system RelE/ParE family toxin n=1 Tax=Novipirellula sp. TaxID=2795430 RepID=UPI0035684C15